MEYSFSTEAGKPSCKARLTREALTIRQGENIFELPLQDIRLVCMEKKRTTCKTNIETARAFTIIITNYLIHSDGTREDKSNAYTLLIRLLHQYLHVYPKTEFFVLNNASRAWWQSGVVLVFSLLLLLVFNYLQWTLDSFTLALIGVGTFVPVLVTIWLNRFPKAYKPTDIPLDFLP